jgi:multidrug efflux pump subunit AcrB
MWIVQLALRRPHTFIVMAVFIVFLGAVSLRRTPTDIFPVIDIPVVSVIWEYQGMSAKEMESRITTYSEYTISSAVNDVRNFESQTVNGISVIKIFFHPNVNIASAVAQVAAISQTILAAMPPGTNPPIILQFNASSVPILQMSLSSKTLSESQIYDYGLYRIRNQLAVIQGITLPSPYGGSVRQIVVDLDPRAMLAKGLSPSDISEAISAQNLTLPTGSAKIGETDYPVSVNSSPVTIEAFNDLPIKQVNGGMIYLRDVANVRDGSRVQTNVVRRDGQRGALLTILKSGGASTLDIIEQVKKLLPSMRAAAPPGLEINLLFDQSLFVRAAVEGVIRESIIAACLTALMILLFLGSWRSTLIVAVSIPLSILFSLSALSFLGHTLNVMTLGGLALAVGILVDDATVEIENIHRNMARGTPLRQAILDGASQIAVPTLVSTMTICIVFVAVVFLEGPAKFLFTPLALAVVFAMGASYLLSRTLVPIMANRMLHSEEHVAPGERTTRNAQGATRRRDRLLSSVAPWALRLAPSVSLFGRLHDGFTRQFENLRGRYVAALSWALRHRGRVFLIFAGVIASTLALLPFVGRDFFPRVDAGQFRLHVRAPAGTRLEETARIFSAVEDEIRRTIPAGELDLVLDNIGLPSLAFNLAYGDSATTGTADGEILVALNREHHRPTEGYVKELRDRLRRRFPAVDFYWQPADIVSQILNFGLPAPIDIKVAGYGGPANYRMAREIQAQVARIPGAVDVHLHQVVSAPSLNVAVDRTRAAELGLRQRNVANDLLVFLSGTAQVSPEFWVDPMVGIPYAVSVRTPQYRVRSIDALWNTPVAVPSQGSTALLSNLATFRREPMVAVANHSDIQPAFDIYANVQDRDLGSVAREVEKVVAAQRARLAPGNTITLRGQVESMNSAFLRLGLGVLFAAVLVYLLMVVNFQSWLDPFIIITALPGAFAGIIWMLFVTQTTFSVPALMGALMCIGVATANSILVVTFANEQRSEGKTPLDAALAAGTTRLRPVLMTALAMIIGMFPVALGLGEGGEQNAPLGRAVVGGLLVATFATLFFVPVVYSLLHRDGPTVGSLPRSATEAGSGAALDDGKGSLAATTGH